MNIELNTKQKLEEILQSKHWSKEDILWLQEYIMDNKDSDELENIMQEEFNKYSLLYSNSDKSKQLLSLIRSKINVQDSHKRTPVIFMFTKKLKWQTAASVLLFVLAGSVFLLKKINTNNLIVSSKKIMRNDILPGHKTAILKLNNGQIINLDSVSSGIIAKEGNVAIIKKQNGELVYQGINKGELLYNEVATLNGQELNIYLPDGTEVFLNAASSIRYPLTFTSKERLVTMTGEAYFIVKHNEKAPFKIQLKDQIIEDIGTEFNVNAYNDEPNVKTTLLRGAVKITKANNTVLLKPYQQAVSDHDQSGIKVINPSNIEQIVAWKTGYFNFKKESIEEIMRQAARWYNVQIVYKGKMPNGTFNAEVPRNESISVFLKILESTGWIRCSIEENKVIITDNE